MSAQLRSPDGTTTSLFSNLLPLHDSMRPMFDDETTYDIYVDAFHGYQEVYRPDQSLTAFDGTSAYGQWELSLTDEAGQPHQADLDEWCLIFTDAEGLLPAPCCLAAGVGELTLGGRELGREFFDLSGGRDVFGIGHLVDAGDVSAGRVLGGSVHIDVAVKHLADQQGIHISRSTGIQP